MSLSPLRSVGSFATSVAATPNDSVDLPSGMARGIYAGGGGTVTFVDGFGATVVRTLAAGETILHSVQRIMATGTAATQLEVGY